MMTYTYDPDENVIHLRASGVLEVQDPIDYFEELAKDDSVRPDAEERVYFQGLKDISFTYSGVQRIRAAFEEKKHYDRLSRTVFLVDNDLAYGMARMVISVLEVAGHEFRIERTT